MFDPMEFEIDEPEKVVYVVGIGPGDVYYLTQEAQNLSLIHISEPTRH